MKSLVSHEECDGIIRKVVGSESFKVIDHDVSNYSDGYPGFLGDYFTLKIQIEVEAGNERIERFFLKSLPVSNLAKREDLIKYGIFKKEADVFAQLFPNLLNYSGLTKWAPVCYLARDDLLVLEDLKLSSYQTLPKHIDPDINHIKIALRSLAAFHAANIVYERLELRPKGRTIGDTYKSMLFETSYGTENAWCMTGIRALKAVALNKTKYGIGSCYQRAIEEEFIEKVCKIFERFETDDDVVPKVCCHRDLWKNNLMYRFANDDFTEPLHCLMVDFQICRYLSLTVDVMICILTPSRDHSNSDECIKFYYEELSSELKLHNIKLNDLLLWDDFVASCEKFKPFPLIQQGLFWSLTNLPESYLTNLLTNDEKKYIRICNENRDDVVLEFIEKDAFYRETMIETVEKLIEYLFVYNAGMLPLLAT